MDIAIPLFPRVTALDAVGPYEVLQRLPGAVVHFVGHQAGTVRTDNGMLGLCVDATFSDIPQPEVLVVPGGIGTFDAMEDPDLIDWIRTAHDTSRYTTSVCTGSLLLGAAGLLDGRDATTHWGCLELLRGFGANPSEERVVERGKIVTAAGVSSGIDMALRLAELLSDDLTAQALQLGIEYDPQPPFDAGSTAKAGDAVMARFAELAAAKPG